MKKEAKASRCDIPGFGHEVKVSNLRASYGAGICAERTAAVKAVSSGDAEFAAIAVAGFPNNAADEERDLAFPCGICRQFLNEFACAGMPVYIARAEDDYYSTTLDDLLPHSFGPNDLIK